MQYDLSWKGKLFSLQNDMSLERKIFSLQYNLCSEKENVFQTCSSAGMEKSLPNPLVTKIFCFTFYLQSFSWDEVTHAERVFLHSRVILTSKVFY